MIDFKVMASAIPLFILLLTPVLAIPGIPNQFYGEVYINGNLAPDGTEVLGKIDGEVVKSTTTTDGHYSLIVDDPNNDRPGSEISFFVNDVNANQVSTFCNGCNDELDLTVSIQSSSSSSSSTSSSSGGSSGGYVPTTEDESVDGVAVSDDGEGDSLASENENEVDQCRENWTCTNWSYCEDGQQRRTCTDQNECGTDLYKPLETQPCDKADTKSMGGISLIGRALTNTTNILLGIFVIGLLVGSKVVYGKIRN